MRPVTTTSARRSVLGSVLLEDLELNIRKLSGKKFRVRLVAADPTMEEFWNVQGSNSQQAQEIAGGATTGSLGFVGLFLVKQNGGGLRVNNWQK